jgi:hypothetical protein
VADFWVVSLTKIGHFILLRRRDIPARFCEYDLVSEGALGVIAIAVK